MADLQIARADYGVYLSFTVQDSTGAAYDLTSKTVSLKAWRGGKDGSPLVNATCEVTNATGGLCRYSVGTADFPYSGDYKLEIEMTSAGLRESTDTYTIEVKESA